MTRSLPVVLALLFATLFVISPLAVAGAPGYDTPTYHTPTPVSGKYEYAAALNNAGLATLAAWCGRRLGPTRPSPRS